MTIYIQGIMMVEGKIKGRAHTMTVEEAALILGTYEGQDEELYSEALEVWLHALEESHWPVTSKMIEDM